MDAPMIEFSRDPDPQCELCRWVDHATDPRTGKPMLCGRCEPVATSTLEVSGPEGLEEGLRELRKARWFCLNCNSQLYCECEDCTPIKITARKLIYNGEEPIDFGAADPGCGVCGGSGQYRQLNMIYRRELIYCPCRRYKLDGVTVKLEGEHEVECGSRTDPVRCDCGVEANLAAAREQLEAVGVEVKQ